ncbi:DMT family transporter [Phreatobacter sp. AB_2022a]|uniref:DMT family transporter n=1 Tax=Phreatobacter sp. AB_2022a TaxID=3003134 RepID=UPI0022870E71|nr:DMT family transporter [Phreatobacter sp. AB_2022a]MCZ0735961.1 DMT family transporter [Phreatobacter sp. AB_2022a]
MVEPAPRNFGKVVFWMAGSLLSFCAVAVSVRALSARLTVFEILALRNLGGLVLLAAMALLAHDPGMRLRPARPWIHVLRNGPHFLGQALWAYGLTVLPLTTVFAIEFTTPAWVAVFAVLFLGERMSATRLVALALGFVGVVVILRPGMDSFRPEALVVAGAAVCFGIQITTTKFLTASNSTWTILFWMNLMQLPLNLGADVALGEPLFFLAKLDPGLWLPVAGICFCGLTAHYCLTNAFRFGDAIVVIPIDFLRVPLIGVIGWLLYAERPELAVLVGAGIVISGVLINIYAESRAHAREGPPRPRP